MLHTTKRLVSPSLGARYDLSHLYTGMRLPTPPEHIKFLWREQDFCKNVLLARRPWGGYASIGGRLSLLRRSTETLRNKAFWNVIVPKRLAGQRFRASQKRQDAKTKSLLTFLTPLVREAT